MKSDTVIMRYANGGKVLICSSSLFTQQTIVRDADNWWNRSRERKILISTKGLFKDCFGHSENNNNINFPNIKTRVVINGIANDLKTRVIRVSAIIRYLSMWSVHVVLFFQTTIRHIRFVVHLVSRQFLTDLFRGTHVKKIFFYTFIRKFVSRKYDVLLNRKRENDTCVFISIQTKSNPARCIHLDIIDAQQLRTDVWLFVFILKQEKRIICACTPHGFRLWARNTELGVAH